MEVGELPSDLVSAPQQLIAIVGLDISQNSVHKSIYDAFTLNRRHDRLPLNFQCASVDNEFPKGKPRRTSYDSYVPRGILKTNWICKHLKRIPSVVVLFMDLDWSHTSWLEKKTECQSKVESLRHGLEGRNTRLAVVLIQTAAPWPPGEDVLAAERATELCTACDLSPKSLFVLPKTDHLHGYVLRLEHAFHELAQAYYQAEVRRVKSKKEFLNKATHQSLLVRCQFKLGFFNEMRQDSHSALRHYKLAFQHLTELSLPENHWLEWKAVAGFLNYKICRLCFNLNTPLDAISQFRRHVDFFRVKTGGPLGLAECEHSGWLSRQFSVFAELFETAVQNGLAAIQTQHPGFYFHSAAQQAMARKTAVQGMWSSLLGANYPSPDPLGWSFSPSTPEYDLHCVVDDSEGDASGGKLYLLPGKSQLFEFAFVPRTVDVGNDILINSVSLDVGQLQSPVYGTLHWEGPGSMRSSSVSFEYATSLRNVGIFERKFFRSSTKIIARKAALSVHVSHKPPVLLNELYLLTIKVCNNEKCSVTSAKVTVNCESETNGDFNPFMFTDNPGTQHMVKPLPQLNQIIDNINPSESIELEVYAIASDVGDWNISFKVDYCIRSGPGVKQIECHCVKNEIVSVTVIQPFSLHCRLLTVGKNEAVERFVQQEPCLIAAEIKAASPFELLVENIEWNLAPFLRLEEKSLKEFSNVSLKKEETCSMLAYVVPISLSDGTVAAGCLQIVWKRRFQNIENGMRRASAITRVSLPCFAVEFCPVMVRASLPAYGCVRQPLAACLTLVNLSDSVLEVQAALESAEAFMFSGHKQVQLRMLPHSERQVRYVYFPLVAGNVSLPVLRLSTPSYAQDTLDRLAQRTLPTQLFVLPYGRELSTGTGSVYVQKDAKKVLALYPKETLLNNWRKSAKIRKKMFREIKSGICGKWPKLGE